MSDIQYVKGTADVPADTSSKIEINALCDDFPLMVDFRGPLCSSGNDEDILHLKFSSSLKLEAVPLIMSDSTILCDTSTGVARQVVPKDYRRKIFKSLHNLSHLSIGY